MQPSTAPTQALGRNPMLREICDVPNVRLGSWLCENAKTLNRDGRSYSSKTVLVAQRVSGFNLEVELKNIILRRVSIFEFLHSQGQLQTSAHPSARSALLLSTDIARATRPLIQMSEFSARVRPQ